MPENDLVPRGACRHSLQVEQQQEVSRVLWTDISRNGAGSYLKRLFDICFSLTVLILTSPLFLIISLLIKWKSPGGLVFFCQERPGLNHKPFRCLKFRTMVPNAEQVLENWLENNPAVREEYLTKIKLKDDPRIIPKIGDFLRRTSLDELPQFINVLKGDMGVVGPRPILYAEVDLYQGHLDKLLSVRPGITGLWQVSGRNNVDHNRRIAMQLAYLEKQCFWLDLTLICKTLPVLLGNGKNNGC